ncbi:iron-sulfur cluster biosynthesis family protein [Gorillibacterium sp. sgz5001074]|uniref:iron-sulfur cluster biosynthesis family protein n=1 Tax=Gorillibacterium sp. sgz5001074 TaxID=3446695 RepID=UPI003F67FB8D
MRIEFHSQTEERLRAALAGKPGIFKLFYDVVECGCNGVLVLLIVDEPEPTDIEVEGGPFRFVVDNRQEAQFDAVMRLEADPGYPSFKVTSDGSMFSSNLRVRDERRAQNE